MFSSKIGPMVVGSPQAYGKSSNLHGKKISFLGSAAKVTQEVVKPVETLISPKAKWYMNFEKIFDANQENYNIIVTAFGTAIVAPIVLALNPMSKEDKNTKQYTALRQPISATLALITQLGVNQPIPRYLDKKAAEGQLGYEYLPNPNDSKMNFSEEVKKSIKGEFVEALKDNEFKERIADFNYKEDIKKKEFDLVKDFSLWDRYFNPKVKSTIKQTIKEETDKIKKLDINEIKLEHAFKYTSDNLKTFKKLVGVVASVLVLYPTFTTLNWIYPRFVEKCFPHLVKDKGEKASSSKIIVNNEKNDNFQQFMNNKAGKVGA